MRPMRISIATLFLALLATLLASLAAIQVSQSNLHSLFGTPPLGRGELLFDFEPGNIARLNIANSTGATAAFHWKDQHWRMERPADDRADYRHLQSLVLATRSLRVEDVIPRDELNLDQAGFNAGHYQIELINATGERVAHYHLGRRTPWHRVVGDKGELAETFFIRPAGCDDFIYVCSGPNARPLLDSGLNTLRDHRPFLFNAADLSEIRIRDKSGELVVARASLDGPWLITKPLELRTNPEAVARLAKDFYKLEALAIHDPGTITLPARPGDDPFLEIVLTFLDKTGKPIPGPTLTVAPPSGKGAKTVFGRVSNRSAIFELPLTPTNSHASLSEMAVSINDLRSHTLCSLNIAALKSATLHAPGLEAPLVLTLGRERISGRPRWMISQGPGIQPANEATVGRLITAIAIDKVIAFASDAAADLKPFGLDPPSKRLVLDVGTETPIELLFGSSSDGKYHAMRSGTPTVAEIDFGTYSRIPTAPFVWRNSILWSFSIVDLTALRIEREDRPSLDLTYDFISESWTARREGEDVTHLLNTQRADILANKLEELRASRWLGPDAYEAQRRLDSPALTIEAAYRATDSEGNPSGIRRTLIDLVPASDSDRNQLYFGRLSGDLDYFLIDKASFDHLDIELLEK